MSNSIGLNSTNDFHIRPAVAQDIRVLYDFVEWEGWNPGLDDAWALIEGMLDSLFVGVLEGEIIGSVAITYYSTGFAYISFVIVHPKFRGHASYGFRLWNWALKQVGTRNIIIDTMPGRDKLCRKLGFKQSDLFCAYYFEGHSQTQLSDHGLIFPVQDFLEEVLAYDAPFFPGERYAYMKAWLSMPCAKALLWKDGDTICGYGLIRKALQGYRIGPLYADTLETARHLFLALIADFPNELISLSMPLNSPFTEPLVEEFQLRVQCELQRLYLKSPLDIPYEKIAAITNFTFG